MRKNLLQLLYLAIFILSSFCICAQAHHAAKLFRVYEDNDFLNIRGSGTDRAYTGGTRFDLFYFKKRACLFTGIFSSSKDSIIRIAGWSLMQTLFTPTDITDSYFQPRDYLYSGSLFIVRSLYAYDPIKRTSLQTELLVGIRGPAALGKQTQTFIHRIIHYTIPKGWDNQLQNAPVVNLNVTYEKQLTAANKYFELIAGTSFCVGTFNNGLTFSPQIRWGIMHPYFDGYIGQFSNSARFNNTRKNRLQAYVIVKPSVQLVFNNASLEGGLFAKRPSVKWDSRDPASATSNNNYFNNSIRHWVYAVNYGVVVSTGKFSMSFIQNSSTELRRNTYSHEVGNISLYFIL